jgi:hypothetical protein
LTGTILTTGILLQNYLSNYLESFRAEKRLFLQRTLRIATLRQKYIFIVVRFFPTGESEKKESENNVYYGDIHNGSHN